jgi:uncharacterized protein (TIGR00369 family)
LTEHPNSHDLATTLQAQGWSIITDEGFIGLIGPFFQCEINGHPHFAFPTDHRHHNLRGVLQGGALMTFADRILGVTARYHTKTLRTATMQLDVHFVDAVQIGEMVEATPQVVRATRSVVFMRCELKVGERIVGTAQGVWKLLK